MRRQAEEFAEIQGRRQERFEESAGKAIQSLAAQMEKLLAQSVETNRSLQDSMAVLSQATSDAIAKMNQGAETLYIAASDFAKAGQGVSGTLQAATEATSNIKSASTMLSLAATAAKEVLGEYARTRDAFAAMVAELNSVIENARKEAAMTSEFISKIEAAVEKLSNAQNQAEEYLQKINDVLAKTHESFAKHVSDTMRVANADFQKELRTAVNIVSSAIQDLGDVLEDIPRRT